MLTQVHRGEMKTLNMKWLCYVSTCIWIGVSLPAFAQERPLSAINWLSDSLNTPSQSAVSPRLASKPALTPRPRSQDITSNALPDAVSVAPLDAPNIDAVGLLSSSQTGLMPTLWGNSTPKILSREISSLAARQTLLPASRRLLNTLVLAELSPPTSVADKGMLFLARIDALLAQGLLEEADALMQRAGSNDPEVFKRAFDTKLLLGTENEACAQLQNTRGLLPTLATRVFCLARSGDWNTAVLTLETADTLGVISKEESLLLAQFLDPELAEGAEIQTPSAITPLTFRLREAIGTPIPTQTLPIAFAQSDLRSNSGWKVRATAAERLARVGAISPNRLLGLWSAHLPAASGGIWDRIDALQRFETALKSSNPTAIASGLENVWPFMQNSSLETTFATLFAPDLAKATLPEGAHELQHTVALLSSSYEAYAAQWSEAEPFAQLTQREQLLQSIALGDPVTIRPSQAKPAAIFDGFTTNILPESLNTLVSENRLGEAILLAIGLLEDGATGNLGKLTDALRFFRAAGLEHTARRAALEILLLDQEE